MKVLVTGHAGFIGFHTARRLMERGDGVVGIDCVNDYYDPALKRARLAELDAEATRRGADYESVEGNLADRGLVEALFRRHRFDRVVHLAAQAGVRHSLIDPYSYVESNLLGFTTILEGCRHGGVGHLTFASTSSVYGMNRSLPFREDGDADHPIQFYAATKRGNELMAHSYAHLYRLPVTGLRFFTVYGPWGRPDMALFKFTRAILAGEPVELFNEGRHTRDFTYVGDIAEGVIRASDRPAEPESAFDATRMVPDRSSAPFRIFNIGNNRPVELSAYIEALEQALGKKAIRTLLPLQPGDVPDTFADVSSLESAVGTWARTSVEEGVARFVEWYRGFYGV